MKDNLVKYPKTDDGRRRFIKDSLQPTIEQRFFEYDSEIKELRKRRTLPHSVNVPEFLTSNQIVDTSFTVEKHHIDMMPAEDATPRWIEVVICVVLSPILIIWLLFEGGKWIVKRFSHDT
jgi:hypothetical protein